MLMCCYNKLSGSQRSGRAYIPGLGNASFIWTILSSCRKHKGVAQLSLKAGNLLFGDYHDYWFGLVCSSHSTNWDGVSCIKSKLDSRIIGVPKGSWLPGYLVGE